MILQISNDEMRSFITVQGSVNEAGEVTVASLVRVPTRLLTMSGARTDYVIELIGNDGKVAASAPVFTMPAHQGTGCGCGGCSGREEIEPPFAFIAAMADVTAGNAIRISASEKHGSKSGTDKVVCERKRPRTPLALGEVSVELRKNKLYVAWDFDKKPLKQPGIWLRWSEDGKRWNWLATGLKGKSATLDPSVIPATAIQIQVLAHDGFNSAAASATIELPKASPQLAVLHPRDGQRFWTGGPLHLWGSMLGQGEDLAVTWSIDGEVAAKELDSWTELPAPGDHVVEWRVPEAEAVTVTIVAESDGTGAPK